MTSELRDAVEVWRDAYEASYYDEVDDDRAAAAVIEADREAVRAWIIAVAADYMGDIEYAQFKHAIQSDDQFFDLNNYWYRQGKDDGIEQERGNICEWLRKLDRHLSTDYAARAIEAGVHLK